METIAIIKTWKEYIYTYRRINLKSVCKSVFKSSTSHYSWATLGATSGDRIENKSIYRNETWRWSTRISEKIHRWNPRTKEMRIPLRGGSASPTSCAMLHSDNYTITPGPLWPASDRLLRVEVIFNFWMR